MQTVREPLGVLDAELRVVSANQAFLRTFALSAADVTIQPLTTLDHGEWDIPALKDLLNTVLSRHTMFQDFPVEQDFRRIGYKTRC